MTADVNGMPAIELRSIDKSFGAVHANRRVSMTIAAGSITGIIGENGAGKSTLMSILYGLYQADSGMVHQHFMLVDTFTVLENVVLGAESGPLLRESLATARDEIARLGREY